MNPPSAHAVIQELLGAYAVNAVAGSERALIEKHLPACPRCRSEVAEHREAAAMLSFAGSDAPPRIWALIEDQLESTPPPLRLAPPERPSREPQRFRRGTALLGAVAATVLLLLGVNAIRETGRLDRVQSALHGGGLERQALSALTDRRALRVALQSDTKATSAQVAVLRGGTAFVIADRLPALPADRTYQLWVLRDGERISAAVLGARPTVATFHVAGGVNGFAVTAEQAGGVTSSKQPPVAIGFTPTD